MSRRAIPERYLTRAHGRPNVGSVKSEIDAKTRSLMRLAQLLQRRFGETEERSFVMMMADLKRNRKVADEMVTQPLQTFR